jgi:threonine synthase
MDISKASNFERFVFDLLDRDGDRVRFLFGQELVSRGFFDLSADPCFARAAAVFGFVSGSSTHQDRLASIAQTWRDHGFLIDPHTADALKVALEQREPGVPMIVLETALPVKFSDTVQEAVGFAPERPARFVGIEALPRRVQVMKAEAAAIKELIARECTD